MPDKIASSLINAIHILKTNVRDDEITKDRGDQFSSKRNLIYENKRCKVAIAI